VSGVGGQLRELDLQATFHPEAAIGNGYSLLALHLAKQPPSAFTDSQVHQLAVSQSADGHWPWNLPRPPIQSSAIAATALAVQAIKHYPIPGRQREFDQRVQRARAWLGKAMPESNEERAYQLLGLAWAGERAGKLTPLAEELIREQRADGGWGQLARLPSDAFATGQSLYALMQGGAVSPKNPAVQNGLRFLLRTQLEDGTWHIRRRAFPFQPPMESSFPHGADGWISSAGTSWAVMALSTALDPSYSPKTQPALAKAVAAAPLVTVTAAHPPGTPVEFARDIQPLFERSCVACHSGERAKGGFQIVNRAALLQGGKRGEPAVVPGQPDASPLIHFVQDKIEDMEMPPIGRRDKFPALSRDETAQLRAWIDQGADWPEGVTLHAPGK
jgi:mono/diheme cytochrome c family protein